jgi:hypothetical protein
MSELFQHSPPMRRSGEDKSFGVAEAENLLSDWFEAPVVVTSSGRSGLALAMEQAGCSQYRTKLTVPDFLSHCVINALTLNSFPIHKTEGDATLVYHQYGFKQVAESQSRLVFEDIAHAFFASTKSGARNWMAPTAAFSLPKFFGLAGLLGGLVVQDRRLAQEISTLRDSKPHCEADLLEWRRETVIACHENPLSDKHQAMLHGAYALYLAFPHPDPSSMSLMPRSIKEIRQIGEARAERVKFLSESLGRCDAGMLDHAVGGLPFAFPFFDDPDQLKPLSSALMEMGLQANIYNIDIKRNLYHPDYRLAIMVPCHHLVPFSLLDEACKVLRND